MPGSAQALVLSPGVELWILGLIAFVIITVATRLFYPVLRDEGRDNLVPQLLSNSPPDKGETETETPEVKHLQAEQVVMTDGGSTGSTSRLPGGVLPNLPDEWREQVKTSRRWLTYVVVIEVALLGTGLLIDVVAGPSTDSTKEAHMIAALLGATAVIVAIIVIITAIGYVLILLLSWS